MYFKYYFLMLVILLVYSIGCSSSTPVMPSQNDNSPSDEVASALDGLTYEFQQIIMHGTMEINPDDMNGKVLPGKNNEWNFNITSLLAGGCPGGCFTFQIVGISGTVFEIELTIENPTTYQAYDIKLIYENLYGKTVMNPDSYTDMFKPFDIRPFTAFAKGNADRAFPVGPGATNTETLFLDLPPGSSGYVDYIIVASFPNQTLEPYEINSMNQDGMLTPSGGSSVISCFVLDHQWNTESVDVDTTPITGGITSLDPASGIENLWLKEITNSQGAPSGTYTCLIQAISPNPQNISTYNYIELIVEQPLEWDPIEEVHLSETGWYSVDPDIAFDSEGYAHICWTEVENVGLAQWNQNIWYSNNTSGTWSTPVELSDAFQNINDYIISPSAIAVNNQNQICVVWTQEYYNGDRPKLWWNFFDGGQWLGQTQLFDLTEMEVQPQLCSDDGFFYLAFRHGHYSPSIMFSKLTDGSRWTEPVEVSDPIDMEYYLQMDGKCAITAASRGGLFITWLFYDVNPEGIYQVTIDESWDGGATWGMDQIVICDEYAPSAKPSIAMDGGGNLYELWQNGNDRILWDTNKSGSWGTDIAVYDHYGASYPAFDATANGHQHVCFIDSKILPIRLSYIESSDGITWTSPIQISPDEGECEMPSVDTWDAGKVGVTWKQHMGGYSNDILYREKSW